MQTETTHAARAQKTAKATTDSVDDDDISNDNREAAKKQQQRQHEKQKTHAVLKINGEA